LSCVRERESTIERDREKNRERETHSFARPGGERDVLRKACGRDKRTHVADACIQNVLCTQ